MTSLTQHDRLIMARLDARGIRYQISSTEGANSTCRFVDSRGVVLHSATGDGPGAALSAGLRTYPGVFGL